MYSFLIICYKNAQNLRGGQNAFPTGQKVAALVYSHFTMMLAKMTEAMETVTIPATSILGIM